MTSQTQKRLIFHWTAPRNLLAVILFIILSIIIEYLVITSVIPSDATDRSLVTIPLINLSISPLHHLLPIAVMVALTASFTHLTTHTAIVPQKIQDTKKPPSQRPARFKALRQLHKRIQKTVRSFKNTILKTPAIAQVQHRIVLAKAIIKSAIAVTTFFIVIILLVTFIAYPKLLPTATAGFYKWNTAFLGFITWTQKGAEAIANAIPPIGAVATSINNALASAAPSFRNSISGVGSTMTSGLVSLGATEKYLIIQNLAAWTVALAAIVYTQYIKIRRYRR